LLQRLEFLGDAVLDILLTRHLFNSHKDTDEGELTDLRCASVNNENFAQVAVKHKFHQFLQHSSAILPDEITEYANSLENSSLDKVNLLSNAALRGPKVCFCSFAFDECDLTHDNLDQSYFLFYWYYHWVPVFCFISRIAMHQYIATYVYEYVMFTVFAMQVLGDIVESIAGAVLIDTKLDLDIVWGVFKPLLSPIVTPENLELPPFRELLECCSKNGYFVEIKCTVGEKIEAALNVQLKDKLLARRSCGKSKKDAKAHAASMLLKDLEVSFPFLCFTTFHIGLWVII
jgi:dsRNA-specific ribonuclease